MKKLSRITGIASKSKILAAWDPDQYFIYDARVAILFRRDTAEFHAAGSLTGCPEKSMKFHSSSMAFYPNGNGNGIPTMFLKKKGALIEVYRNGNGNGVPSYSIRGPWDERKIAELFFVLLSIGYLEG